MSLKKPTPFFYKHSLDINFVLTEMYRYCDIVGKLKFYIFHEPKQKIFQ